MLSFKTLWQKKDYEKIEFVLRRHWLIPVKNVLLLIIEILLPIVFFVAFSAFFLELFAHPVLGVGLRLLLSSYMLLIWLLFFFNFVDYYLDVWIVTNERLINIEQKGLFSRTISELRYYRIQDVTSEVKGIVPTLFHYGDVYVQTAAERTRFIMKQVPGAHEVSRKIHHLLEADRPYHEKKIEEAAH